MPVYVRTDEPLEIWRRTAFQTASPIRCEVTTGPASVRVYDHIEDRWILPFVTAGSYTLTITPDAGAPLVLTVTAVAPVDNAPVILPIGDSITEGQAGYLQILTQDATFNATYVGTQTMAAYAPLGPEVYPSISHQGHSGKEWDWFTGDPDSPFTDGSGNLTQASVDAYVALLASPPTIISAAVGTNHLNDGSDIVGTIAPAALAKAETLFNLLRTSLGNSALPIIVNHVWQGNAREHDPPAGPDFTGFGGTVADFRRRAFEWNTATDAVFGGREAEGYFVNKTMPLQLDGFYGFEPTNNVHPTTVYGGHPQIARSLSSAVMAIL